MSSAKVRIKNQRRGVQVIERAANILRSLEGKPEGLSLGEIAKDVLLPRSTVQRIIDALEAEKFVIAASPNARVRLGPGLVSLGSAAKFDIETIVRPFLVRLSEELNETVDLSILDGTAMIIVDQVQTRSQRLQAVSFIGMSMPLHCCANGKAMLATLDMDTARLLTRGHLKAYTENTITSRAALEKELHQIRKAGCAYDREEHTSGVCAVGVGLNDPSGSHIAISIPVPATRFYGSEKELTAVLSRYRLLIEKALGSNTLKSES